MNDVHTDSVEPAWITDWKSKHPKWAMFLDHFDDTQSPDDFLTWEPEVFFAYLEERMWFFQGHDEALLAMTGDWMKDHPGQAGDLTPEEALEMFHAAAGISGLPETER